MKIKCLGGINITDATRFMLFTYGAINQAQEMIYEGATYKAPPLWGTEKDKYLSLSVAVS